MTPELWPIDPPRPADVIRADLDATDREILRATVLVYDIRESLTAAEKRRDSALYDRAALIGELQGAYETDAADAAAGENAFRGSADERQ